MLCACLLCCCCVAVLSLTTPVGCACALTTIALHLSMRRHYICRCLLQRGRHHRRPQEAGRGADGDAAREDPHPEVVRGQRCHPSSQFHLLHLKTAPSAIGYDCAHTQMPNKACSSRSWKHDNPSKVDFLCAHDAGRRLQDQRCALGSDLSQWRGGRYTVYKDHITLEDYEVHDGMGLELYYN